jgi:4-amino-4-deoxy-L-arabinose transferase-like glycosyltransferase
VNTVGPHSAVSVKRRIDVWLLLILLAAFGLRLHLAISEAYLHDEINTAIPLAETISFTPGAVHLPLRGENHGALPAYVVKASRAMFGTSMLGTRLLHVLLGLFTVVLVSLIARQWYGPVAARWAAALMAFNEYYLGVSSRATAHVPHMLFVALAVYALSRFLARERAAYLYGAALALGLAFYCKEHSALLLPVFFFTLLAQKKFRPWLWRPQVYVACAIYALVLAPDVIWNAETNPETAQVTYNDTTMNQATYRAHLQRIGGLGFSLYPSMFYERQPVRSAYAAVTGGELHDETPEYPSVNPALGVLLIGAVLLSTFGAVGRDDVRVFLLIFWWGIFAFFTLIKKGDPPGRLDPVSWIWVETTILPAIVLTGARLATAAGKTRAVMWLFAAAALMYACEAPLAASLDVADVVNEGMSAISHSLQVLAEGSVVAVRSHPLRALMLATAAGGVGGVITGWLLRGRR